MKVTRYTIVPGETEQQAIENGRDAFRNLCKGDYDLYSDADRRAVYGGFILLHDAPIDDTGVWQMASSDTVARMKTVWEDMMDELREFHEGDDTTFSPGSHNRTRKFRIYDQHGGAVACVHRFQDLIESDDHWVVAAQFSF